MSEELKPCWCCGKKKSLMVLTGDDLGWYTNVVADSGKYCVICSAATGGPGLADERGCGAATGFYHTREEAINAWNRRYDTEGSNGWMNVKTILPKPYESVLAITDVGEIVLVYLSKSNFWMSQGFRVTPDITHWMPLSPPGEPKGEEHE